MQEIKQGGRSTRKGEIYKRTVEYMQNERKWNIYKKESTGEDIQYSNESNKIYQIIENQNER